MRAVFVRTECSARERNPFPRGEGGPLKRVGRGMREEIRKSVQYHRPNIRLVAGPTQVEVFRFPVIKNYRPHSSSVRKIGSEEPIFLTASPGGSVLVENPTFLIDE